MQGHADRLRHMPEWTKRAVILTLLLAALVLAARGVVDRGFGWCGLSRLEHVNERYLDSAFDGALAGFLILSGIKSGLAIVEGSSVGVGVNVELGDVVQPVYDYVDIAWRAAMAGASVIVVMQLALQGLAMVDHWALVLFLAIWFIWILSGWIFPRAHGVQRILKAGSRFSAALCLVLYLILPLTITGASLVSQRITKPLLDSSQAQFETLGEALSPERLHRRFFPEGEGADELSTFDLKGKIAKMGQGVKSLVAYLKLETEQMAAATLKYIAAYVFDCILFPLFFGLILMTMLKSGVRYLFELDRLGRWEAEGERLSV